MDSAEITEWQAYFQLEAEARQPEVDEKANWRKAFNCG